MRGNGEALFARCPFTMWNVKYFQAQNVTPNSFVVIASNTCFRIIRDHDHDHVYRVMSHIITLWSDHQLCYAIWLAENVRMWRNDRALLSGNARWLSQTFGFFSLERNIKWLRCNTFRYDTRVIVKGHDHALSVG